MEKYILAVRIEKFTFPAVFQSMPSETWRNTVQLRWTNTVSAGVKGRREGQVSPINSSKSDLILSKIVLKSKK